MPDVSDMELLRDYRLQGSEAAFAELVQRHINLVYSAALRHVGIAAHAEEITQAVFIILARKAAGLRPGTVLEAWLYETTRLTALSFLRGERRRQFREQEAYMQSTLQESADAAVWHQLAPLLDEAMARLGKKDREAVVLRFFSEKNLSEVAAAMKTTEAAAQSRVHRALEKLRKFFTKRGVALSGAAIAGAISANSVQAAPVGLAAKVTAAAAKGTLISATLTMLVKGTMKTMAWMKFKFAAGVGVTALLVGGVVTVAISQTSGGDKSLAQEIARKSQDAYAALTSYSDSGIIIQDIGSQTLTTTFNIRLQRPNFYRVDWSQETQFFTNGGIVWSAGNGDFLLMKNGNQNARPTKYNDMATALAAATGISGQASSTIPSTFFNQNWGGVLKTLASGRTPLAKQKDEIIDGVDYYVVSSSTDPGKLPNNAGKIGKSTTTLWIGKQDYLIHQSRTVMEGTSINLPKMSDATIGSMLQQQKTPVTPEAIASMRKILDSANQQAKSSMASGRFVFTQTHENIVENPNLSAADFAR